MLVVGALIAPPTLAQTTAAEPAIGYWTDTEIVVADANGQGLGTFRSRGNFSLNGPTIAVQRKGEATWDGNIVAYDIASGERRFRITDAFGPVVTGRGNKIAFLPTAAREGYIMSVWMRTATGRIKKVVQFKPGPGLPGVPHGMRAGGGPLEVALDERGRTMAVAFGLETIRTFDVWVVDTKTKEVKRLTRSNRAHSPSVSPDGSRVAVWVENAEGCPDDFYGEYFAGKIRLLSPTTGEGKTLTPVGCDLFYGNPRWIDDDSLLTIRVTRDETETYGFDLDLVRIDVTTGETTEMVTGGNPCCIVTSPSLGKVAYEFSDRPGFSVLDIESGTVVDFPEGSYAPQLSGQNRV
jgi:hypothetical protein